MSEAELRERLAHHLRCRVIVMPEMDALSLDDVVVVCDAILQEIEAAGFVIMERGRVERLERIERWAQSWGMDEDDLREFSQDVDGNRQISVVCDGCHKSQQYWPLNANGELEVAPDWIGCQCDMAPDDERPGGGGE